MGDTCANRIFILPLSIGVTRANASSRHQLISPDLVFLGQRFNHTNLEASLSFFPKPDLTLDLADKLGFIIIPEPLPTRTDQQTFEALPFQFFKQRDPLHSRTFHGYCFCPIFF